MRYTCTYDACVYNGHMNVYVHHPIEPAPVTVLSGHPYPSAPGMDSFTYIIATQMTLESSRKADKCVCSISWD